MEQNMQPQKLHLKVHRLIHMDEALGIALTILFTKQGVRARRQWRRWYTENGSDVSHLSELDLGLHITTIEFVDDESNATPTTGVAIGTGGGPLDDHAPGREAASSFGLLFAKYSEQVKDALRELGDARWVETTMKWLELRVIRFANLMDAEAFGEGLSIPSLIKAYNTAAVSKVGANGTIRWCPDAYSTDHAKQLVRLVGYLLMSFLTPHQEKKAISPAVDQAIANALMAFPGTPWSGTFTSLKDVSKKVSTFSGKDMVMTATLLKEGLGGITDPKGKEHWNAVFDKFLVRLGVSSGSRETADMERIQSFHNGERGEVEKALLQGKPSLDVRRWECPWGFIQALERLNVLDNLSKDTSNILWKQRLIPEAGEGSLTQWAAKFLLEAWLKSQERFHTFAPMVAKNATTHEVSMANAHGHLVVVEAQFPEVGSYIRRTQHPAASLIFLIGRVDQKGNEQWRAPGVRYRGAVLQLDLDRFGRKGTDQISRVFAALVRAANRKAAGEPTLDWSELWRTGRTHSMDPAFVPAKPWNKEVDEAYPGRPSTRAFMVIVGPSPSYPEVPQVNPLLTNETLTQLARLAMCLWRREEGQVNIDPVIRAIQNLDFQQEEETKQTLIRLVEWVSSPA